MIQSLLLISLAIDTRDFHCYLIFLINFYYPIILIKAQSRRGVSISPILIDYFQPVTVSYLIHFVAINGKCQYGSIPYFLLIDLIIY